MAALCALDNDALAKAAKDRMPPGGADSIIFADEFTDDSAFRSQETNRPPTAKSPERLKFKKLEQQPVLSSPRRRNYRRSVANPRYSSGAMSGVLDHTDKGGIRPVPRTRGAVGGSTTIDHCLDTGEARAGRPSTAPPRSAKKKIIEAHPATRSSIGDCLNIVGNPAPLPRPRRSTSPRPDVHIKGYHGGGQGGPTTITSCLHIDSWK